MKERLASPFSKCFKTFTLGAHIHSSAITADRTMHNQHRDGADNRTPEGEEYAAQKKLINIVMLFVDTYGAFLFLIILSI